MLNRHRSFDPQYTSLVGYRNLVINARIVQRHSCFLSMTVPSFGPGSSQWGIVSWQNAMLDINGA